MLKNKKVILAGTVLVAGAIAVAGTFAWFTDSDEVVNKFKLGKLDIQINDVFGGENGEKLEENIEPGKTIEKDVTVENIGSVDTVIRVQLKETLALFDETADDKKEDTPVEGEQAGETPTEGEGEATDTTTEDNAIVGTRGYNKSTIDTIPEDDDDITTLADLIKINHGKKEVDGQEVDVVVTDDAAALEGADWWYDNEYFYYLTKLPAGEETVKLVDSVEFTGKIGNELMNADYTLTPVADAQQYNADAIKDAWGTDLGEANLEALLEKLGLAEEVEEPAEGETEDPTTPGDAE